MAYTRNAEFEVNDMTDGVVLFDVQRNVVHHLNGPATLVWEVVEGRELEEVTAAVAQVMEIPPAEASAIARECVEQLQSIHALTE